jgi:hypothetical protein
MKQTTNIGNHILFVSLRHTRFASFVLSAPTHFSSLLSSSHALASHISFLVSAPCPLTYLHFALELTSSFIFVTSSLLLTAGIDDAHNLAECSNMGMCDRDSGLCQVCYTLHYYTHILHYYYIHPVLYHFYSSTLTQPL